MTRVDRLALWLALLGAGACEREKPSPAATPSAAETATSTKPAEPTGPPGLSLDKSGALVGFTRIALEPRDGLEKLRAELEQHRRFFDGQEAKVQADRQVKPAAVATLLAALGGVGATRVLVRTSTRAEYPSELGFLPPAKARTAPACSIVAMILEDRGTAVWKLSGGSAGKRGKGMAGPDLTLTAETIAQRAKSCPESSVAFVAGAEGVDWGLVYDLAASTKKLPKAYFTDVALLGEPPVPGHPVKL